MGFPQQIGGEAGRQFAGVPHLYAIGEDDDLDETVMAIVAMGNRIDDGFQDNGAGNLERNGGLCAFCPRADAAVDLAKNELHCLIDHFE